jgi:hypothetical protein
VLTGVVGRIEWHYYVAAAINGYTVDPPARGAPDWRLVATVVLSDAYNLNQRPLTFVAKHARGEWRFPVRAYELHDSRLTARLGPPEGLPKR